MASTQFAASYVPHHLMATAFSLNVQQARGVGYSSSQTRRAMASKMDQSFKTFSFDEPCATMAWTGMVSASLAVTTKSDNWEEDADLVVVGVFAPKKEEEDEDDDEKDDEEPNVALDGGAKELDKKLGGALSNAMLENAKAFSHGAKAGSVTPTIRAFSNGKSQRFVVVGLGTVPEGEDAKLEGVGSALGNALASMCDSEKKVKSAKVLIPDSVGSDNSILKDLSTSFYASLYSDNRFRTGKKVKNSAEDLESVTLVSEGSSTSGADEALAAGKKLANGIYMTKDIVNSPHNVLNSLSLADTARRIAEESGGVMKCTVLGKKECEERGMGAYLGVARGSETEPQFIHLTYTPPDGEIKKKIGIVGKGK